MDGQDDDNQQSGQDWQQPSDQSQVVQPTQGEEVVHDGSLETPATQTFAPVSEPATAPQNDWQQPAVAPDQPANDWTAPAAAAPVADEPAAWTPPAVPAVDETAAAPVQNTDTQASSDLMDIKQKALNELSPLVGHLDQTPEEKFKTTMMMIQASDNQSLIGEAYEAAQAITDEKAKAQALLDIVNEINYFTQHTNQTLDAGFWTSEA